MNETNLKREIRKISRNNRNSISEDEQIEKSQVICNKIITLDQYKEADVILAYMSTGSEVRLQRLIDDSIRKGKKVYIPKVIDGKRMEFYLYDGNLEEGAYGIREPADTDESKLFTIRRPSCSIENMESSEYPLEKILIIMPGLAFDHNRNRLGYGGGYYDRYLGKKTRRYETVHYETKYGNVSDGITTVAVAYDIQIIENVPTDEFDIRPDIIISESKRL